MKDFEQWLGERLRSARTEDSVDADRLWNRLEHELPASTAPTGTTTWTTKGGLGLLLILVAAAITALFYGTNEEASGPAATGRSVAEVVQPGKTKLESTDRAAAENHALLQEKAAVPQKLPVTTARPPLRRSNSSSGSATSLERRVTEKTVRPAGGAQPPLDQVEKLQPSARATAIASLPLTPIPVLSTVPLWDLRGMIIGDAGLNDRSFVRAGGSPWALTLRSGANLSFPDFGGRQSEELPVQLAAASDWVLGHGSEVQIQYWLSPSWSVGFGVGLNKTVNAFRYQYSYDTVAMIDGHVGPALATRRISHNNRLLSVTLPLSVEWRRSLRRVDWGISVGAGFNVALRQSGKTLTGAALVHTYDGKSDPASVPVSGSWFSLRLLPFLRYRLDNRTALEIAPSVAYHRYGTSPLWQLETSALTTGLQLGIRRGW